MGLYTYGGGRLPKPKPNTQGGGYTIEMEVGYTFQLFKIQIKKKSGSKSDV